MIIFTIYNVNLIGCSCKKCCRFNKCEDSKKENKVYYQFFYFSNIENNTNISIITNKIERIEIPSDKYIKLNVLILINLFTLII